MQVDVSNGEDKRLGDEVIDPVADEVSVCTRHSQPHLTFSFSAQRDTKNEEQG
jgi:hypothetical protein